MLRGGQLLGGSIVSLGRARSPAHHHLARIADCSLRSAWRQTKVEKVEIESAGWIVEGTREKWVSAEGTIRVTSMDIVKSKIQY